MKTLPIKIDCEDLICGNCKFATLHRFCRIFNERMLMNLATKEIRRLPECIKAAREVEASAE